MGRKKLTSIITEFSAKAPDVSVFGAQLLVAPIRCAAPISVLAPGGPHYESAHAAGGWRPLTPLRTRAEEWIDETILDDR